MYSVRLRRPPRPGEADRVSIGFGMYRRYWSYAIIQGSELPALLLAVSPTNRSSPWASLQTGLIYISRFDFISRAVTVADGC